MLIKFIFQSAVDAELINVNFKLINHLTQIEFKKKQGQSVHISEVTDKMMADRTEEIKNSICKLSLYHDE